MLSFCSWYTGCDSLAFSEWPCGVGGQHSWAEKHSAPNLSVRLAKTLFGVFLCAGKEGSCIMNNLGSRKITKTTVIWKIRTFSLLIVIKCTIIKYGSDTAVMTLVFVLLHATKEQCMLIELYAQKNGFHKFGVQPVLEAYWSSSWLTHLFIRNCWDWQTFKVPNLISQGIDFQSSLHVHHRKNCMKCPCCFGYNIAYLKTVWFTP